MMTDVGEALFTACIHGNVDTVQSLLLNAAAEDVNYLSFNVSLYTALMMATAEGHLEVTNALLAHPDIDVNIAAWDGKSALTIAAEEGRTDIIQSLIAHPSIDVNIRDMDGYSALMLASNNGHTESVRVLLSHPQIDINILDRGGNTALSLAGNDEIESLIRAQSAFSAF